MNDLAMELPAIPADHAGPVFREPWEAQAFALAVALHRAGYFTWPEWVATIGAVIDEAQSAGDADLGDTYYHHWLTALERITVAKNLAGAAELHAQAGVCEAVVNALHDHPARREPVFIG